MKKILFIISIIFLLNITMVFAHEHDFSGTKQIIDSGISCDTLTEKQLEAIGDYYMEQMHPGEAHEIMDTMMGGEGSQSLKQMHTQMAKRFYCNENIDGMRGMMGGGMMNMMLDGGNMMGGNIVGGQTPMQTNMMQGMMGNWGYGYWGFLNILYVILLIGLIILVYLWIIRLLKNKESKK